MEERNKPKEGVLLLERCLFRFIPCVFLIIADGLANDKITRIKRVIKQSICPIVQMLSKVLANLSSGRFLFSFIVPQYCSSCSATH